MEPISVGMLAAEIHVEATAAEAAEVAAEQAAELTKQFEALKQANEFQDSLRETLDRFDSLRNKLNDIPDDPSQRLERLQELTQDSNTKGQIGEAISEWRDSTLGDVEHHVEVKGEAHDNVVDHVTTLDGRTAYQEVTVEEGRVRVQEVYEEPGTRVATEVKNGNLQYLENQARDHLPKQIEAGKQVADTTVVEINQNCLAELIQHTERAKELIRKINDAGARLVVGLPTEDQQLAILARLGGASA